LKYYHPNVGSGKYNWDLELFKILPVIQSNDSVRNRNEILSNWIKKLETFETVNYNEIDSQKIKVYPQLQWIEEQNVLGDELSRQLNLIKSAKREYKSHYVSFSNPGNPVFDNELSYSDFPFPDKDLRLLTLFRYWNIIEYFYPYRYLIPDWDKVLSQFIPLFINAKSKGEYTSLCLRLISSIQDTHANVFGTATIDSLKGIFICPFQVKWVENKYVVTNFYHKSLNVRRKVNIGDVIEGIDGVRMDTLVKKYSLYTSASNRGALMKILGSASGFILRSNKVTAEVSIARKGVRRKVSIKRIPLQQANTKIEWVDENKYGFSLLDSSIGYIYASALKYWELEVMMKSFKQTKGLIIDLRCYPSVFMPFTFGKWLKATETPFAKISTTTMEMPGRFGFGAPISNGGLNKDNYHYKGKIVLIVNSSTLSQGEYTTMALRTIPGAVVVGSNTAGADGDVSLITLPGNIKTLITGTGVYYPNAGETQRIGITPDIIIEPSIKGVNENRDELLEMALSVMRR
jgi:hypothetical protein